MVGAIIKLLGGKFGALILGATLGLIVAGGATLALLWRAEAAHAERVTRDRDSWRDATRQWQRAAGGWQASFRASEQLRRREQRTARASADDAARACLARVESARRSARAIQTIVTKEVPRDAKGCPVRGIVDGPGGLRDALQAPAARAH